MDYFIDRVINLTEQHRICKGHSAAIRHNLMAAGLNFADANQFAMFATYGFHGPKEKQTLSMRNKWRLSALEGSHKRRGEEPSAWNQD